MIGRRLRLLTAGESHGERLLGILDGMPAGVPLSTESIDGYLWRRQGGVGRGARMSIERDRAEIAGGVWKGATSGGPVGIVISNRSVIPHERHPLRTVPRPGHADLTGMLKHGFDDANPAIERSSARETAMRVALGAVAHALLRELGVVVVGHVVSIGGIEAAPERDDWEALVRARDASPVYSADRGVEAEMLARIAEAKERQETLGGVAEVVALGVPPGFGAFSQGDARLETALGAALLSIPSVKAVAVGDGIATAGELGRGAQDEIFWDDGIVRRTNRAGGIEGGISNGSPIVVRAWFKPISTQRRPLRSVDLATRQETECRYIRSDTLVVPAGSVVAEAMVALAIADAMLGKLGGDSIDDSRSALRAYVDRIPWRAPALPAALFAPPVAPVEDALAPVEET